MCDCVPSINFPPQYSSKTHKSGFSTCFILHKYTKFSVLDCKKSSICVKSTRDRDVIQFPSDEHGFQDPDFGLMGKEISEFQLSRDQKGKKNEEEMEELFAKGRIDEEAEEDLSLGDFLKFRNQNKDDKLVEEDNTAKPLELDSNLEELERHHLRGEVEVAKNRRQMMRRSSLMAKQVISTSSALSLGFASQLWIDTSSWVVIIVEVRPKLLSGDFERFLLKDITQVGDVILIEDKNVIEDDLKLVGLETLVGYNVVTPTRQSVGKVRGYTFNINSGSVELLELDSFGISVIPSNLVSTYALHVEDVLEVLSDTVVVREAAVSRIQRLTKGFWDGHNTANSIEEPLDTNEGQDHAGYSQRRRKNLSRRKSRLKMRKSLDDWELPMDYF